MYDLRKTASFEGKVDMGKDTEQTKNIRNWEEKVMDEAEWRNCWDINTLAVTILAPQTEQSK